MEEVTLPFLGDPFGTLATLVYGEIVPSIKALAARREGELHAADPASLGRRIPRSAISPRRTPRSRR